METDSLKLELKEGVAELRTGEALPLKEPVKVKISGLIDSPSRFFVKRKGLIDKDKTHLVVNRNDLTIGLQVDETDYYGTLVSGTLKYNKELADFGINKNKTYSLKEITQLLRLKRMHFDNREEHSKVIEKLYGFEAKVSTSIKDSDNRKGNIDKQLKKDTESNVPAGFKLNIAIYEGQSKSKLFVDVLADISDVQTKFWFESVDLIELEYDLANEIIDNQIKIFADEIAILEI